MKRPKRKNRATAQIAANFRETVASEIDVIADGASPRVGNLWWLDSAKARMRGQRHFVLMRHCGAVDKKIARIQVPSQKPNVCKLHLSCGLKTFRSRASNRALLILSPEINIMSNAYGMTATMDMEGSSIAAQILIELIKRGEV